MELTKALTLSLGSMGYPVITQYQLGKLLFALYKDKKFRGEKLAKLQKDYPEAKDLYRAIDKLTSEGVLSKYQGLPNTVFTLLGRSHESPEDVACTIDPFCYLSHLSAMDYHGLTNRIPAKLFLSSPANKNWRDFANKRMQQDLKDDLPTYIECGLPSLTRVSLKRIGRREVHVFNSLHLGAFKNVRDRELRVATIGRTFLDMLREPELCGGINHVLEVYAELGEKYLRLITDEIDKHGKPIDKVRAGYILDERMSIKNDVVESWSSLAQRGGSRKLDPSEEYVPNWSDKWCLSINIFE